MNPDPRALAVAPPSERGLQLRSLDDMTRFAEIVVKSGLAPKSFDTPAKVVMALVTGAELGISAMQSLQNLAVTNGRIGVMGDMALALIETQPDFEDYQEEWSGTPGRDDWGCRITIKRRGRAPRAGEFTVAEAKIARLWGKTSADGKPSPWVTYPKRMLRYRALGFAVRDAYPHVLKGIKTLEELADYPNNEEPQAGFEHARPVIEHARPVMEARAVDAEPQGEPTAGAQNIPKNIPEAGTAEADARLADGQELIEGTVARAWPSDYQGKRYYFVKLDDGRQLQTSDEGLGGQVQGLPAGTAFKGWGEPSPKSGKFYLKRVESIVQPQNPRAANRAAAKARHESGQAGKPADPHGTDDIPMEDNPEWARLLTLMEEDTVTELYLLKALKGLGWIPEDLARLTDVSPRTLKAVIEQWPQVATAALKAENEAREAQAEPEAQPQEAAA
jgi:hypothetical protein